MKASDAQTRTVSYEPGAPFPWRKGLWLQALDEVTILLPGEILLPAQPIDAVIDAPEEARVSFDFEPSGGGIAAIRIALKVNMSLRLLRSSMAMVTPGSAPARFRALGTT